MNERPHFDDSAPPEQAEVPEERRDGPSTPAPEAKEEGDRSAAAEKASIPWGAMVVAGFLVVAGLGWGAWQHWRQNSRAAETQSATNQFVPAVRTADARREQDPIQITLPGQTEAFQTASIFARATGYISERKVDIGSRVKKGDLLVHISAPDLDQQLAQAEAQLGQVQAALTQAEAQITQARANLALQTTNQERTDTLAKQGFATTQSAETQRTTVESEQAALVTAEAGSKVAEANLRAQQATVDRLRALAAFENVVAPFDGIVTARNVEVGDLVNADSGSGTPMFTVDSDQVLRIAVRVPQYSAQGIRDGLEAKITVPQLPGRTFTGKVARSSVALLYSTRTLTTEVDVPNPDGALRPGLFVDVSLAVPRTETIVSVPADALIFNQHGMRVAVVGGNDQVQLRQVEIQRDLGTSVELKNGLNGGEKVVVGPPVDLREGEKVKTADSDNGQKTAANGGTD